MCGIAGIRPLGSAAPDRLRRRLSGMVARLVHRGPDEDGAFVDSEVALGSRRLRVIGLEDGRMPIANETDAIWVAYNGEIYNYRELRSDLLSRGHQLRTSGDTEVLVHLYEEYGAAFVEKLNGMFAFALWDGIAKRLFLARDRVGIKPLFYRIGEDEITFASELKALVSAAESEPELDVTSVAQYLALGYIPAPHTIYRGYAKLPPGSVLEYRDGRATVTAFWRFPNTIAEPTMTEHDAVDALDTLLHTAVRERLVADVPLGAFLSGGVDSSLVVALAARQTSGALKTFSIGFEGRNELPYARRVAERWATDHHELLLNPDSCRIGDELLDYFDEPFGDSSSIATFFVSKLAREHVTVALSGDGGDELFAGYDQYAHDARLAWIDLVPLALRRVTFGTLTRMLPHGALGWNRLRALASTREGRFTRFRTQELDPRLGGLLRPSLHDSTDVSLFDQHFRSASRLPFPSRLLYVDAVTYLPDDILAKVDRMSMAVSLEARVPILDHRVVEFAAGLPFRWKMRHGMRKRILKRVAERYVPHDVLHRPKRGFSLPVNRWLRNQLRDLLVTLQSPEALSTPFLYKPTVDRLVREHHTGRRDHSGVLWRLVMLESWLQRSGICQLTPPMQLSLAAGGSSS